MNVRTRIAPSPTGAPHLGTAYIALFNKALAMKHDGEFILRIEDSDQSRNVARADTAIQESLRWLGLEWDEGPDSGGPFGPYRTSERLDIYRAHLDELLAADGAFHCFCTTERVDGLRRDQQLAGTKPGYDGHCLRLDKQVVRDRLAAGEPYVIRLNVPRHGDCQFVDEIRGEIKMPWDQVDMQILLKSDGYPTYHLCATVDDHLMEISHILRGEEWLNSCPKHQLIYTYLGWKFPKLFHLPLLRNPDQSKLSKRKHPTGINYYKNRGYLPEALTNYLATMGWSMPDEREIFSFKEFVEALDLNRITPRGPVFDPAKLDWLNGCYIREMDAQVFQQRFVDWATTDQKVDRAATLVQQRVERFDQLLPQVRYLFAELGELSAADFDHKSLTLDDQVLILDHVNRVLEIVAVWEQETIHKAIVELANAMDLKIRDVVFPLFLAISGSKVSLPLFESIAILGDDVVTVRIRQAIEVLGGISKKKLKRLDSNWRSVAAKLISQKNTE